MAKKSGRSENLSAATETTGVTEPGDFQAGQPMDEMGDSVLVSARYAGLFTSDVEIIVGAFALFLAVYNNIGHGGALALAAIVVIGHGVLRELGSSESVLKNWLGSKTVR